MRPRRATSASASRASSSSSDASTPPRVERRVPRAGSGSAWSGHSVSRSRTRVCAHRRNTRSHSRRAHRTGGRSARTAPSVHPEAPLDPSRPRSRSTTRISLVPVVRDRANARRHRAARGPSARRMRRPGGRRERRAGTRWGTRGGTAARRIRPTHSSDEHESESDVFYTGFCRKPESARVTARGGRNFVTDVGVPNVSKSHFRRLNTLADLTARRPPARLPRRCVFRATRVEDLNCVARALRDLPSTRASLTPRARGARSFARHPRAPPGCSRT